MIRFPCVYCGQEIEVPEQQAGTQMPCPACGHTVRVRPIRPEEPAAEPPPPSVHSWDTVSDEEIKETILYPAQPRVEPLRRAMKRAAAPLLPRYDDLTLFTMSFALGIVLLLNPSLRQSIWTALGSRDMTAVLLGIVGLVMVFSLINVFFIRDRSDFEKVMMLFFAIVVTAVTGVAAGGVALGGGYALLAIFPAWNALHTLLLLVLAFTGILDTDCLADERIPVSRILIAAASVTVLLLMCRYIFRLDGRITYSIAVCYTMSLLSVIQDFFAWAFAVRRTGEDPETQK
jgi:DNA-directed RNA polymerase subunit RPC12/RpoP